MDDLSSPAAQWFLASGPFGIVGILSYALWKINEKKDAALREIYERVAEMSATQTKAIVRMVNQDVMGCGDQNLPSPELDFLVRHYGSSRIGHEIHDDYLFSV